MAAVENLGLNLNLSGSALSRVIVGDIEFLFIYNLAVITLKR